MVNRILLIFILSVLLASSSAAQNSQQPSDQDAEQALSELDERAVALISELTGEIPNLRLPQNRAVVLIVAGDMLWKFDSARSMDLFSAAENEFLSFNIESERTRSAANFETGTLQIFDLNNPRYQLLPLVAKHNAELALEMLLRTRPVTVAEAMLKPGNSAVISFESVQFREELQLEQRFAVLAAEQSPDLAIKLIRESLSKGITSNVLQLLQKLHKKDEKKASELAAEVVKKLTESDINRRPDDVEVILSFLRASQSGQETKKTGEKPFTLAQSQLKALADHLVSGFLQSPNSLRMTMAISRALPVLEKIVPEKAPLLKQKMAENSSKMPAEFSNIQTQTRIWDRETSPEDLLGAINKMQSDLEKSLAYPTLTSRILEITDEAKAAKLIDQIPDEDVRKRAKERYQAASAARAADTGKISEARKRISSITDLKVRIKGLVDLAIKANAQGGDDNIELAKNIMSEAASNVTTTPEDEDQVNDLLEVIRGYTEVEPNVAFSMFEPVVEMVNDIVMASAILSKYNRQNQTFRKGEMQFSVGRAPLGNQLLNRYVERIRSFAKADLERTISLTERFQRPDTRTIMKLAVLEGYFSKARVPTTSTPIN